jgi:hypothetical protein
MATNGNDQTLRSRLLDEPSVKPSDTRVELQDDRMEAQQVRHRVLGRPGVAPADTLEELREAEEKSQRAQEDRDEREEEERRRDARRQAEAAQQAEREREFARELAEVLAAGAGATGEREVAIGFEQREALLDRLEPGDAGQVTAQAAQQWAERDAQDLGKLQDTRRSVALDRITENVDRVPGYREALAARAPDLLQEADVRAAANAQRSAEKEVRKAADFEAMRAGPVQRPGTPRDAANEGAGPQEAANDARRGQPMAIDAADLQRVAAARARDKDEAERLIGARPLPPADRKAEERGAKEAVDRGLQAQLAQDQAGRGRSDQAAAGNTVDVNRTGKELERGEFIMPRRITQAYNEVDGKFFAKDSNRVMFEDRGSKLATSTTDKAAIADMVALAKAKQWESLKLSGSQEFRREAWLQAESQGIRTQGYTPKQADLAALEALRQERTTNSITPLQERRPAERERQAEQPVTRAPRHDLNKNQAAIHDAAVKALTSNLAELHKRPELRGRSDEEMQKLAYWRGVVAESNKLQPEPVQKEALARFDRQAENPDFVRRLAQETEPKVQEKTTERVQARETHEQSL